MAGEQESIEAPPMDILTDEEDVSGAPAPDEAPEKDQPQDPGQPRDEQGRFQSGEDQPTTDQAPPQGEAPSEAPEAPEAGTEEQPPGEEGEPGPKATFVSLGQSYELDGSEAGEDGVFFTPEGFDRVQNLLAQGRYHETNWAQEQQRNVQAAEGWRQAAQVQQQRADQLTTQLAALFDKPDDEFYAAALDLRERWPQIKSEAEIKARDTQSQTDRQRLQAYEARERVNAALPALQTDLADLVAQAVDDPRYASLTEEDLVQTFNSLWNNRGQVFQVYQGQFYTDHAAVQNQLAHAVVQRASAQATEQARAHNKAATGVDGTPPPPAVPGGKTPAPSGKVGLIQSGVDKLPPEEQADAVDAWFEEQDFD